MWLKKKMHGHIITVGNLLLKKKLAKEEDIN